MEQERSANTISVEVAIQLARKDVVSLSKHVQKRKTKCVGVTKKPISINAPQTWQGSRSHTVAPVKQANHVEDADWPPVVLRSSAINPHTVAEQTSQENVPPSHKVAPKSTTPFVDVAARPTPTNASPTPKGSLFNTQEHVNNPPTDEDSR